MPYSNDIAAECRRLFIEKGLSVRTISKQFSGAPSETTIKKWAKTSDDNGFNWYDYRDEYQSSMIENLSPEKQAAKLMERVNYLLNSDVSEWDHKVGDELSKLRIFMARVLDKKYQLPAMYEVLKKLIEFLKVRYPGIVTAELVNAVRHFKNELKNG